MGRKCWGIILATAAVILIMGIFTMFICSQTGYDAMHSLKLPAWLEEGLVQGLLLGTGLFTTITLIAFATRGKK